MATDWGHGATLGYAAAGTLAAGSFTNVAQITEIDEKKLKRNKIKKTHLASASNTEEYRAGMVDIEPFKFNLQYSKAIHATLLAFVVADTPNHAWKILFSDGSAVVGDGFIAEFCEAPKASNDGDLVNDIVIQPVGPWIFTPAA